MELDEIKAEAARLSPWAHIATVGADGKPDVVPVHPAWDGDTLWVMTFADSVKVKNIRAHADVALHWPLDASGDGVAVWGQATVHDDIDTKRRLWTGVFDYDLNAFVPDGPEIRRWPASSRWPPSVRWPSRRTAPPATTPGGGDRRRTRTRRRPPRNIPLGPDGPVADAAGRRPAVRPIPPTRVVPGPPGPVDVDTLPCGLPHGGNARTRWIPCREPGVAPPGHDRSGRGSDARCPRRAGLPLVPCWSTCESGIWPR